jgi:hypothetical protein
MSYLIADYAESLRQSLSFDRQSAQRLANEAEDHLYEALDHDSSGSPEEVARRAIQRFGSPTDIATEYTKQIFPDRLRATWRSGLLLGTLILLTMWLRRALDLLPRLEGLPGGKALLATDSIGFRIAIAAGILAWLLSILDRQRRHMPLIVRALIAAAGALCLSISANLAIALAVVINDGVSSVSILSVCSTLPACVLMVMLVTKIRVLRGYAALMDRRQTLS